MHASSLRRRHRSLNVFVQSWRRWIARRADQLLETARLGSDNLEYLTHDWNALTAISPRLRAAMPMTCCGALCSRSTSTPMNSLCRIPLCFVTCAGGARCARAGKIVRPIWRGHRPVKLG